MSSLLGLLAEYSILPRVINASAISSSLKVLNWNRTSNIFLSLYHCCTYSQEKS